MNPLFETQLEWIRAMQQFGTPYLNDFFRGVTFMGEEMFFLLFIPFLVWSIDLALGARVGVAFLLSAYLNPVLKDIFDQPRPFHLDPTVKLSNAEGTGMPSGHAQNSIVVWGVLAAQVGKRWLWALAVIFMLLIGFSRAYLGVHFPTQVAAGWAIGIILLAAFLLLEPRTERWLSQLPLPQQVTLAGVVPIIFALLYPADSTVSSMGVLAGFGSGLALTRHYLAYGGGGVWWQRLIRYVVGAAVMLAIYFGLSFLFDPAPESLTYPLRFVRYGMLGLWIALGAPWLFTKIHLADTAVSRLQLKGS